MSRVVTMIAITAATIAFATPGRSSRTDGVRICKGVAAALRAQRPPYPSGLAGDVDGDKKPDAVYIARNGAFPRSCRYIVVLRGTRVPLAFAPVRQFGLDPPWPPPGLPKLTVLATIDSRRGAEIGITTWAGASSSFLAVYQLTGDGLHRLAVPGQEAVNTFPYGGSPQFFEGVSCLSQRPASRVIASEANSSGDGATHEIVRKVYELRNRQFVLKSRRRIVSRSLPANFGAEPFANCAVATAR